MKRISRYTLIAALCLISVICLSVSGCTPLKLDPAADHYAREYLVPIVSKNYDAVYNGYSPQVRQTVTAEKNRQIMNRLWVVMGPFDNMEVDEYTFYTKTLYSKDSRQKTEKITIIYQLRYSGKYAIYAIHLQREGSGFSVISWNISQIRQSLFEINRFDLAGKEPRQYLFLVGMAAEIIFVIAMIVLSARSTMKRKYIWCILCIVGACSFSMNWHTGEFSYQILTFQLMMGVAWSKTINGLMLTFTIPIGAILALLKMRQTEAEKRKGPAKDKEQ